MARSKPTDTPSPTGKAGTGPTGAAPGRSKGSTAASAATGGKADTTGKQPKAPKLGKDGKPKVGRIKKFRNSLKTIGQAYKLTYKNDRKLPWVMLIAFVAVFAVVEVIAILFDAPLAFLPVAVLLGLLAALIIFGRRAQGSAYRQVEGQPQRVRSLIAQEKKKIARVVGDTPIYDIMVGDDEGQVPLKKLSNHVMKLPRNLSAGEVNSLGRRMSALGGPKMPIPGGPLPGGKQMSVSQRQVRRR